MSAQIFGLTAERDRAFSRVAFLEVQLAVANRKVAEAEALGNLQPLAEGDAESELWSSSDANEALDEAERGEGVPQHILQAAEHHGTGRRTSPQKLPSPAAAPLEEDADRFDVEEAERLLAEGERILKSAREVDPLEASAFSEMPLKGKEDLLGSIGRALRKLSVLRAISDMQKKPASSSSTMSVESTGPQPVAAPQAEADIRERPRRGTTFLRLQAAALAARSGAESLPPGGPCVEGEKTWPRRRQAVADRPMRPEASSGSSDNNWQDLLELSGSLPSDPVQSTDRVDRPALDRSATTTSAGSEYYNIYEPGAAVHTAEEFQAILQAMADP